HEDALGEFEDEPFRREPGRREDAGDAADEARLGDLPARDIDTHQQRLRSSDDLPQASLAAGLLEDPLTERDAEPGLFGDRDEVVREDQAALGMAPAQQCLDPDE